ncbi:MAG: hypothetical protein GC180_09000 [Bacteroidetes bacterium]|nr:hypothetical protein [Bacteroidota bacterium]
MMIFLFHTGWSQNSNLDYHHAIKLYSQTSYTSTSQQLSIFDTLGNYRAISSKSFQLIQPSLAYQWKTKKNNFHEVAIGQVQLHSQHDLSEIKNGQTNSSLVDGGQKVFETSFILRYEYIINLRRNVESKFAPSIGFAGSPYFFLKNFQPVTSHSFPVSQLNMGMKLYVTPRISYYFNSKFFLDLNIPICLSDMAYNRNSVKNPAFTRSQQVYGTIDFNSFPRVFSGRLGIGMKL